MSSLKESEVQELYARFGQFANLSAEQKLKHFDFQASKMCSDEWRANIKQFLQEGSNVSQELMDRVFNHLQLDILEGDETTNVCAGCRTAFWQLVWLNTDVDTLH